MAKAPPVPAEPEVRRGFDTAEARGEVCRGVYSCAEGDEAQYWMGEITSGRYTGPHIVRVRAGSWVSMPRCALARQPIVAYEFEHTARHRLRARFYLADESPTPWVRSEPAVRLLAAQIVGA
jgi:hypothetical protein